MAVTGNIPERIVYIDGPPVSFPRVFDSGEEIGEPVEAPKSFASDAANARTIETGKQWARGSKQRGHYERRVASEEEVKKSALKYSPYWYDHAAKEWCRWEWVEGGVEAREPLMEEFPNVPILEAQVFALEHRNEGGRAYKVFVQGRVFDLREDVLLDIILHSRISNGVIECPLLWAKVGSQMKLIREGSSIHEGILACMAQGKAMKVQPLEYGHLYRTKTRDMVYLGRYNYLTYSVQRVAGGGWRGASYTKTWVDKKEGEYLFWDLYDGDLERIKLGVVQPTSYRLKFQKTKPKTTHAEDLSTFIPSIEEIQMFLWKKSVERFETWSRHEIFYPDTHLDPIFLLGCTEEEADVLLRAWNEEREAFVTDYNNRGGWENIPRLKQQVRPE